MAALGWFLFVFALLVSIALHELGHLVTAKRFGMKASRYFIGMGPTLWSTHRGETEYGVKALPVGGFVKIVGMTAVEDVEPEDEPRAFWRHPAPQRAVVLAAGSFMHFVVAFVVLVGTLSFFGEETVETTRVAQTLECLDVNDDGSCAGEPAGPARVAGLREGDRVVAFEGKPVERWEDFSTAIRAHEAGEVEVVVLRDGERVTLHPVVERVLREVNDEGEKQEVGQIGVVPGDTKRYNPISAIGRSGTVMWQLTTNSVRGLVELPGKIPQLFRETTNTEKPRTTEGGGIVGVFDIGRLSGQALEAGRMDYVLFIVAGLNVFIGLFNLLPLLPLDGGHLAILGFEKGRSRLYRAIGRPDPGRVDINRLMPAALAFIALMSTLTVLLLFAGITNPIASPF